MAITVPVPNKNPGDAIQSSLWNTYVAANINKLLNQGHRVVTVAQFAALTGLEDGDEVYLEVDAANDVQWFLRYLASSGHWRYLGGPGMLSVVDTDETTASAAYTALTTAGPSVTVARAGTYDILIGCYQGESGAGDQKSYMSFDVGAAGAVDADGVANRDGATTTGLRRKTGIAAATALTAKYKTSANTPHFVRRFMRVKPVFVT